MLSACNVVNSTHSQGQGPRAPSAAPGQVRGVGHQCQLALAVSQGQGLGGALAAGIGHTVQSYSIWSPCKVRRGVVKPDSFSLHALALENEGSGHLLGTLDTQADKAARVLEEDKHLVAGPSSQHRLARS